MAAGRKSARTGDLILIRVLHPGLLSQDAAWANDEPLDSAANRSVPMAYGPNLDQSYDASG
jgi:hypothetical protein